MPIIWSEPYLTDLLYEAEKYISTKLDVYWAREALIITPGKSTYSLPVYVKKITRVTWKGKGLIPIAFDEVNVLGYNSAVIDDTTKHEYPNSEPRFYTLHPTNITVIRFLPTPNETITPTGAEDLFGADIANHAIVSFYRSSDNLSFVLPSYVSRRFKKAYALYRAFLKEGKGQNLTASKYYKSKYDLLLNYFEKINSQSYVSQRPALSEGYMRSLGGPPAPPQLPWNYPGRKVH